MAAAAAALSQKGGCPAEPAPCPCCCLLRLRQVVVDCLMLSKVLAVITLMCHFYSPATPYASPLHAFSLPFLSLSLVSSLSALFIFYSASACSSEFPAVAVSLTLSLLLYMSFSFSLSFTLWGFLWCLQTFCQVNLRFVFLIMGLSTLLCKVLNLSMSSSLSLAASVCFCTSISLIS